MSLGHEVGHTPFAIPASKFGSAFASGFRHNENSIRVLTRISSTEMSGLNLSQEVLKELCAQRLKQQ
jgi:dGTPase